MHDVEDPVATAEVPNDSAEISKEKALPRCCRREEAAAISKSEQRVLLTALQDGVDKGCEGDPTEDVECGFGEDQDLKHARCGGQHPGIASDLEHGLSVAKADRASTGRLLTEPPKQQPSAVEVLDAPIPFERTVLAHRGECP